MKQVIGVVDYGVAGNIHSIKKAIQKVGGDVRIVRCKEDLNSVTKLVIPGVGSFSDAMAELKASNLTETIVEAVSNKKMPALGICLGMQILSKIGYEYGESAGMALVDAEVREMKCNGVLPHVGFNGLEIRKNSLLFNGLTGEDKFYFMHSFEVCNYTDVLSLSSYVDHTFVSAIEKDNLYGVQFHPEKSREAGLKIFSNFVNVI